MWRLFFFLKHLYTRWDMKQSFWQELPKPFFALAPMAGVTDTVFRQVIARRAKPNVFWTEFVSCDGLCSTGRDAVLRDLTFSEIERPIVAQIFGATPRNFFETARLVDSLGFDGVDINMGCPEKNIQKQGACAALMRNIPLALEIISATKEGAGNMPVSVKTRIGYNAVEIDSWIPTLIGAGIDALTVHLRTKKEMSDVPAHWEYFPKIVEMAHGAATVVIGNGDVKDLRDAKRKAGDSGADGIMLGRAIFGNPWLFDSIGKIPTKEEKLEAFVEHAGLYESTWGNTKPFDLLKKHCKAYVSGFVGASQLRAKLMECRDVFEIREIVEGFLGKKLERRVI